MAHYWLANEDPVMAKARLSDWLEDLRGFPAALVKDACGLWRRSETRRPTPADILRLCQEVRPRAAAPPVYPVLAAPGRPSDGVIRDDFRDRPVRDWSRAELDTAWNETEAKMIAEGFEQLPAEDARIWHARYARVCLSGKGIAA